MTRRALSYIGRRCITRSDLGMIEGVIAVAVVFGLVGGMVLVAVVQTVMLDHGSTVPAGPRATPAPPPFIGPAPSAGAVGDCEVKKAAERGARWTGSAGWRAPGVWPEPLPDDPSNNDPAVMRGRWRAWNEGMTGLLASIRESWVDCRAIPPPKPLPPPEPTPTVAGTYTFTFDAGTCGAALPPLTGTVIERPFGLALQTTSGTVTLSGTLQQDDLTFTVAAEDRGKTTFITGQTTATETYFRIGLAGRFALFVEQTIIREGRGELEVKFDNAGKPPCTFSFTAQRVGVQGAGPRP